MATIFIVEDHAANLDLLREYLNALGHVTIAAEDGDSALMLAERMYKPAELVLLDIHMPSLSGYEVLATLRALPRWEQVPVLALTASAMADDRHRALAAGFDGFLTKPLVLAELQREIQRHLALAPKRQSRPA